MNSRWKNGIAILGLSLMCGAEASAQTAAATQNLAIEVKPVTRLVVSGSPLPLSVTAGSGSASDGSSTYSLVTNLPNMKIAASIDRPMPAGTSLAIRLESSRGTSSGEIDITGATGSTVLVAGIGPGVESGQKITYRFSAEPGLAELAPSDRTVTLTLSD